MNKRDRESWEKMTPKQRDCLSILAHVMPADWDAAVARHEARFPPPKADAEAKR